MICSSGESQTWYLVGVVEGLDRVGDALGEDVDADGIEDANNNNDKLIFKIERKKNKR